MRRPEAPTSRTSTRSSSTTTPSFCNCIRFIFVRIIIWKQWRYFVEIEIRINYSSTRGYAGSLEKILFHPNDSPYLISRRSQTSGFVSTWPGWAGKFWSNLCLFLVDKLEKRSITWIVIKFHSSWFYFVSKFREGAETVIGTTFNEIRSRGELWVSKYLQHNLI